MKPLQQRNNAAWLTQKMTPLYNLRWRFEYNDGTAAKYGMWCLYTQNPADMATFKKNTNIARALIEWQHKRTFKQGIACHCKGEDFCLFKWETLAVGPGMFQPGKDSKFAMGLNLATWVVGLTIVTRYHTASVYMDDGTKVYLKRRPEAERLIHYTTYGK